VCPRVLHKKYILKRKYNEHKDVHAYGERSNLFTKITKQNNKKGDNKQRKYVAYNDC